MSDNAPSAKDNAKSSKNAAAIAAARRRARIAGVFGDALPDVTRDECGEGHTGHPQDWFEAQKPPHHG